jgi:drug/metabolite transporter (DMT)-like permease
MGIILSLMPLMSLAMAIISLGQRLTVGALAGAVLSFAGVLVVVSSGSLGALLEHGVNLGDAMMLIATLAYAIYSTLLKKWQLRLPPLVLLYMQVWVAVVVLFPLFVISPKVGLTLQNIPLVLYACLLASMLAPLAWMQAVVRLGPSRTTLFFNLLPVITALIAAVVLHEQLAMYHLVGGLLTLGGVVLSERWTTVIGRKVRVA